MNKVQSLSNKKKDISKKLKKTPSYQASLISNQVTFSIQSEKPIDCTLSTDGLTFQIKQTKKQKVGSKVIKVPLRFLRSNQTTSKSPQQEPNAASEANINQPTTSDLLPTTPPETASEFISQQTVSKEAEIPLVSFKEPSFEAPKPQGKRIIRVVDQFSHEETVFKVSDTARIGKVLKIMSDKEPLECRFYESGVWLKGNELVGSFFKDYPEDNEVIIDKIMNCSGA